MDTLQKYFSSLAGQTTLSDKQQSTLLNELTSLDSFFQTVPGHKRVTQLLIIICNKPLMPRLTACLIRIVRLQLDRPILCEDSDAHNMFLSLFLGKAAILNTDFFAATAIDPAEFFGSLQGVFTRSASLRTFPGVFSFFAKQLVDDSRDAALVAGHYLGLFDVYWTAFWNRHSELFRTYNDSLDSAKLARLCEIYNQNSPKTSAKASPPPNPDSELSNFLLNIVQMANQIRRAPRLKAFSREHKIAICRVFFKFLRTIDALLPKFTALTAELTALVMRLLLWSCRLRSADFGCFLNTFYRLDWADDTRERFFQVSRDMLDNGLKGILSLESLDELHMLVLLLCPHKQVKYATRGRRNRVRRIGLKIRRIRNQNANPEICANTIKTLLSMLEFDLFRTRILELSETPLTQVSTAPALTPDLGRPASLHCPAHQAAPPTLRAIRLPADPQWSRLRHLHAHFGRLRPRPAIVPRLDRRAIDFFFGKPAQSRFASTHFATRRRRQSHGSARRTAHRLAASPSQAGRRQSTGFRLVRARRVPLGVALVSAAAGLRRARVPVPARFLFGVRLGAAVRGLGLR